VPLFPALVAAGWVGGGEAGALGAVNFTGYLAGAMLGPRAGARLGIRGALDAGMALAVTSFLACALNLGFEWLAAWRAVAGVAGGVLMALAGPAVQAVTPPERRGLAGGVVVSGVGAGVMAAALLLPALLAVGGLPAAWVGMGALGAAFWAFAKPRWPAPAAALPAVAAAPAPAGRTGRLILAYSLSAAGMAAPMVYLSDLAARGRGMGVAAAGLVWGLFGLGGVAGTLLGGRAADWMGTGRALVLWLVVQGLALGLALLPHAGFVPPAALLSGFAGIGISAVVLAGLRASAGAGTARLWSRATALYALAQAATGYGLAWLFARVGEAHGPVFMAGLGFSLAALAVAVLPGRR
jgi:predicted MFS family arabinose efflux permease